MKTNIIHIHTDPKFLYELDYYSDNLFKNKLVFIGDTDKFPEKYSAYLYPLPHEKDKKIESLIKLCNKSDIIVINSLDRFTIDLTIQLSIKPIILWRFFGWEIYSKEPELVHSKLSIQYYENKTKEETIILSIKKKLWRLINGKPPLSPFVRALNRINYFLGVIEDEHILLKQWGYNLPNFVEVPYNIEDIDISNIEKEHLIILGNSRGIHNNHLDILQFFKSNELPKDLKVKMFFSYGPLGRYAEAVKKESQGISQIELIENFLPKQEFVEIYKNTAAFIFNGYRQMALGNIFTAINYGVKVYLSEKNVTYHWLLKNNIEVFSIEGNLLSDISNDNYKISKDEATSNIRNLKKYYENKIELFNQNLLKIAKNEY